MITTRLGTFALGSLQDPYSPTQSALFSSSDAGVSWTLEYSFEEKVNSLTLSPLGNLWVAGDAGAGVLLKSEDQGQAWDTMHPNAEHEWVSSCFINPNDGWADLLFLTTDGGETWEEVVLDEMDDYNLTVQSIQFHAAGLVDVAWNGENLWVAVGFKGYIWISENNGLNWYRSVTSVYYVMHRLPWLRSFYDAAIAPHGEKCRLVGDCGMILHNMGPLDVEQDAETAALPTHISLQLAYPNPFNSSTVVTVNLPQAEPVTLTIYDVQGRVIASGVYFIHLAANNQQVTQRMMFIR